MTAASLDPHANDRAAYVRAVPAPAMPPPVATTGVLGWMRANLFSSAFNSLLTILVVLFVAWVAIPAVKFLIIDAVWSGESRDACLATAQRPEVGACWAFVRERLAYFIYGSYPIPLRWRVDVFFAMLAFGILWLLSFRAPRRDLGATYFFVFLPIVSFFLLYGGDVTSFAVGTLAGGVDGAARALHDAGSALAASSASGSLADQLSGLAALALKLVGALVGIVAWPLTAFSSLIYSGPEPFWTDFAMTTAVVVALAYWRGGIGASGPHYVVTTGGAILAAVVIVKLLVIGTGLPRVDTALWGGLLVTLVVSAVGIAVSLPLGIVLALGRRSRLPAVRLFSVVFIEVVRGVPLITVLFMASVMLPLFVPEQWSPDKLMRALVGVALFSSAYMAEVVRAGLQAVPKGQYEAAQALGLGYSPMMRLVVLPQALKATIPNIVNSYIALFKDTTLVFFVGIFDFLKTIEVARVDPKWATPVTSATGYAFAALFYLVCCYLMSDYAGRFERRVSVGERR